MRRRNFLAAAVAAAVWPQVVLAQQSDRTNTVGVLLLLSETYPEHRSWFAAFQEELLRRASIAGRELKIVQRWCNSDVGKVRTFATELVAMKPDVLFAVATPVVAALHTETQSIPIVFVGVSDPVGAKFVASFSRPAGNITGFVQNEQRLGGKWLALLKEIAPEIKQAAIMFNPDTAPGHGEYFLGSFRTTAESLGVEPRSAPVHNDDDIRSTVERLGIDRGGLVLMDDGFMGANYRTVIAAAARANVPTIAGVSAVPAEGGLMAYHSDMPTLFRNAASYVDRILRGEAPADLPVQTPIKYQLIINLKIASALRLAVPPMLLAAADEVIE